MSVALPQVGTRRTTRPVEDAAASAWVRPLVLGPAQALHVVGVSGPACYVRVGEADTIALETTGGARLPNAITLDPSGPGVAALAVGTCGVIGEGTLRLGRRTIVVRRWWDPRPRVGEVDRALLREHRDRLPTTIVEGHHAYGLVAPIDRLRTAVTQLDRHALPAVVADLVGRGPGSTPAGDDVLAGLLAALRVYTGTRDTEGAAFADVVAHETRRIAHRTTALSAALLRCADDGAVVVAARRVLQALAGHGHVEPAVAALSRIGHTSGRDLLTGIAMAIDLLTTERAGT